jgi:hypothetical protein
MKETGILFKGEMVRAILQGRKTQTRRLLKPQPRGEFLGFLERPIRSMKERPVLRAWFGAGSDELTSQEITCPYGKPGDRLWVREAWRVNAHYDRFDAKMIMVASGGDMRNCVYYEEIDNRPDWAGRYRHARFMPRWASRITLEITGVRVERLQDISEEDAKADGVERHAPGVIANVAYRAPFISLWEDINGDDSWNENPWVWVIEFKRVSQ